MSTPILKPSLVHKLGDVPQQEHYVIMLQGSTYIPSTDPRDAGCNFSYLSYESFTDVDLWATKIKELTLKGASFRAFKVTPPKINAHVTVEI